MAWFPHDSDQSKPQVQLRRLKLIRARHDDELRVTTRRRRRRTMNRGQSRSRRRRGRRAGGRAGTTGSAPWRQNARRPCHPLGPQSNAWQPSHRERHVDPRAAAAENGTLASQRSGWQRSIPGAVCLAPAVETAWPKNAVRLDMVVRQAVKAEAYEVAGYWFHRFARRTPAPAASTLDLVEVVGVRMSRGTRRVSHQ